MTKISDDQLREMAQHRGLKLIKSRRRKPGVGDFGKYGLTDGAGKPLLGVGEDELTASAEDIQTYLRTSELSTWKESAAKTPDRPVSPKKSTPQEPENQKKPVVRRSKQTPAEHRVPRTRQKPPAATRRRQSGTSSKPALKIVPKVEPERAPEPEAKSRSRSKPESEPVLRIRAVTRADAEELSILLSQLRGVSAGVTDVAENLAMVRKAKAGMIVAKLDRIVGCCGWAVVATVHRGAVGRLTALIVDKNHRRRGIGTQMLAAAEKTLAKAGCREVEALSDIAINNSHNFFRSLKFEQTSYRFIRSFVE